MFVNFNILNQLGSPAINSNTFANRPAAGQTGRLFVSTDTFEIYRDNGTTWDLIGGPGSSTITGTGTATQVAYFTSSQAIGSSANLYWDNTAGALGINTATPGAELDVHGTGTIAQFNTTAATGNVFLAIQRSGTGLWRIGDTYNSGSNYFELHNTTLASNAIQIAAATNKSILTSLETYSTGVARGNLLDYTLSLANGTTFTSPNTVTALGATLNLNIAGSATIPAGARSGADFFNGINFTSAGTFTVNQASTIRAFSNVTAGWAFNGSAVGTVTHLAGLRVLFPTNSGSAINVTDNYALLINDQTANTGTITYTNRWGIYQEGASDLNYMAANLLLGSTVNNGNKLQVTGNGNLTGDMTADAYYLNGMTAGNGALYWISNRVTLANYNANGVLHFEVNGGAFAAMFDASGNFGLGVTPSAWNSSWKAIEIAGGYGVMAQAGNDYWSMSNAYYAQDATFKYITSASATGYSTASGQHRWHIAPSGTAGNAISFTQAMTLDASGRLGIGTTSPGYKLQIQGTQQDAVQTIARFAANNSSSQIKAFDINITAGTPLITLATAAVGTDAAMAFATGGTEQMRITSGGNVLIGTTTDAGQKLQVNGTISVLTSGNSTVRVESTGTFPLFQLKGTGTVSWNIENGRSITNTFGIYQSGGSGGGSTYFSIAEGGATSINSTLAVTSSITTGAPSGGTAAPWKLGSRVAATVVVNTTEYIEVDIGGTLYKLATVT